MAGTSGARPLRLVQVGMGGWGRDWMSVTAAVAGVETVAWVDSSPEARAATVARGAPADRVVGDLGTALDRVEADAALVTTSVGGHVPLSIEALRRGLHVLVEKPFAASLAEAASAIRAADAAGRTLMVSQNYRFHPAPRLAEALVAEGRIGDVVSVEIDFRRHRIGRDDVLRRHQELVHPLLVDMAIHHFDLLRLVLGREAMSVSIEPIRPTSSAYRDPPAAFGTLVFEGDVPASYRGSWLSSGRRTPWAGSWRLEGTRGAIEWASRGDPGVPDALRIRTAGGRARPLTLTAPDHLDRAGTLAAFAESITSGTEPETSGRRNLPTLALTLAAVRSATERRPVALVDLLRDLPEDLR